MKYEIKLTKTDIHKDKPKCKHRLNEKKCNMLKKKDCTHCAFFDLKR